MKIYRKVSEIRKILPKLKTATVPGKTHDGAFIQMRYESTGKNVTAESKRQASAARKAGMDLRVFTGPLDRVFTTAGLNPQLVVTMLCMERINDNRTYAYRSFNLSKGRVRFLKVL